MAYSCRILADSIADTSGVRLTTFEVTYPRFVHAELLTHRMLSRNSASSRAIPVEKMHKAIKDDPVLPVWWGKNQSGMQAREELSNWSKLTKDELSIERAKDEWLYARSQAIERAKFLYDDGKGLHKQIANRITEPWMWITVIVTATEWDNFFKLRCHPDAQPEIRKIAEMMRDAYERNAGVRKIIKEGEWHLPLWGFEGDEEYEGREESISYIPENGGKLSVPNITLPLKVLISAGRCARVSYLTHEGIRDPQADIKLAMFLSKNGHWSPWEHVATPFTDTKMKAIKELDMITGSLRAYEEINGGKELLDEMTDLTSNSMFKGNFKGWTQARKLFPNESGS